MGGHGKNAVRRGDKPHHLGYLQTQWIWGGGGGDGYGEGGGGGGIFCSCVTSCTVRLSFPSGNVCGGLLPRLCASPLVRGCRQHFCRADGGGGDTHAPTMDSSLVWLGRALTRGLRSHKLTHWTCVPRRRPCDRRGDDDHKGIRGVGGSFLSAKISIYKASTCFVCFLFVRVGGLVVFVFFQAFFF